MFEDRILNLADILQAGFVMWMVRSAFDTFSNPAGNATIYISYNGATAVTIAGGVSRIFTIANQQDADSFENSASIHQLISVVRCMVLALPSMHGMSIVMVGLGRMWVQTVSQKRIDLFQQIPSITTP